LASHLQDRLVGNVRVRASGCEAPRPLVAALVNLSIAVHCMRMGVRSWTARAVQHSCSTPACHITTSVAMQCSTPTKGKRSRASNRSDRVSGEQGPSKEVRGAGKRIDLELLWGRREVAEVREQPPLALLLLITPGLGRDLCLCGLFGRSRLLGCRHLGGLLGSAAGHVTDGRAPCRRAGEWVVGTFFCLAVALPS
jgi:hypothetical protein